MRLFCAFKGEQSDVFLCFGCVVEGSDEKSWKNQKLGVATWVIGIFWIFADRNLTTDNIRGYRFTGYCSKRQKNATVCAFKSGLSAVFVFWMEAEGAMGRHEKTKNLG